MLRMDLNSHTRAASQPRKRAAPQLGAAQLAAVELKEELISLAGAPLINSIEPQKNRRKGIKG